MKKIILLIIIFSSYLCAANNAKDIEGFWLMPDKPKGRMKVAKIIVINNKLYAYAIDFQDDVKTTLDIHNPDKALIDKDLRGLTFIYDIEFKDGEWQTGRIYHTDQGSSYYAKITLADDKKSLSLKASLDKGGVVGASVKWTRLSEEEAKKYNDMPISSLRTVEGKPIN
ncbi:DUF2147 domain-containing protein [Brachyspira pilosicoli]|uniref:DUF2147 domain-containing protein n=1 Tax=Brachyspira pilosicoli TaxID=52584 RepID=UPI0012F479A0|nr:DUF2147 domain-containing protein [Brachyspira pilosicoli]